jgi:glutamyl-tRNA synthetase
MALLLAAAPLVQERMVTLAESVDMVGFLLVDEAHFSRDPAEVEKSLATEEGRAVTAAAHSALSGIDTWDAASIEQALREALVDTMGLKPRNAFGPVRVAVSGRRISPPLFESMELLGREASLSRLVVG